MMYKTPNTREGNVEVTDTAVTLHGLLKFSPSETIPLSAIQSVALTQAPFGILPVEFEIRTADGRVIKRRSNNGRKKIVQRFMDEAYTPLLNAVVNRGRAQ